MDYYTEMKFILMKLITFIFDANDVNHYINNKNHHNINSDSDNHDRSYVLFDINFQYSTQRNLLLKTAIIFHKSSNPCILLALSQLG